jgi:tRNA-dihydrouridine synthase B
VKPYPHLQSKAILSPMAGVNDLAFRQLCEKEGAALVFTEMLPAESIMRAKSFLHKYFQTCPEEKRLAVQLMAANSDEAVFAAKQFEKTKDAKVNVHVIDLNVGCPSNTIRKIGAGSALLNDEARLLAIVKSLSTEVNIPISVKIRLGEVDSAKAVPLAKKLEDAGASAIGVHARTVKQGYSGKADWSMIKKIKENVSIPVVGNGDVSSPEKAKSMFEETGCDYVLVGRGCLGKPYIFSQINDFLKSGKYKEVSAKEQCDYFFKYLKLARKFNLNRNAVKTQAIYFSTGLPNAPRFRLALSKCKTSEQVETAYAQYMSTL